MLYLCIMVKIYSNHFLSLLFVTFISGRISLFGHARHLSDRSSLYSLFDSSRRLWRFERRLTTLDLFNVLLLMDYLTKKIRALSQRLNY